MSQRGISPKRVSIVFATSIASVALLISCGQAPSFHEDASTQARDDQASVVADAVGARDANAAGGEEPLPVLIGSGEDVDTPVGSTTGNDDASNNSGNGGSGNGSSSNGGDGQTSNSSDGSGNDSPGGSSAGGSSGDSSGSGSSSGSGNSADNGTSAGGSSGGDTSTGPVYPSANVCAARTYLHNGQCLGAVPVYRWFHPDTRDHFYTMDPTGEVALQGGWQYEGIGFYSYPDFNSGAPGLGLFHRAWKMVPTADHFYTTNFAEMQNAVVNLGYSYEGAMVIFTTQDAYTTPLYRWFHPVYGDHFYTTDPAGEIAPQNGYIYEGVAGFVFN